MKLFLKKSTIETAKSILGDYLVHKTKQGTTIGKIIETEAYLFNDPASHSFCGKTKRNKQMFGSPGKAYVYLVYGMHNCFNVVTAKQGKGEAVLIRALEPIKGIELMKKRRKIKEIKFLCNGPGKLTKAMAITLEQNGADLRKGNLKIIHNNRKNRIVTSKRIGILKGAELPYRFYVKGSNFMSKN